MIRDPIQTSKTTSKLEKRYSRSKTIEDGICNGYKLEPECELSSSSHTNILEAINLIIEDYKKSFLGRSLVLTGKTILIITSGDGTKDHLLKYF